MIVHFTLHSAYINTNGINTRAVKIELPPNINTNGVNLRKGTYFYGPPCMCNNLCSLVSKVESLTHIIALILTQYNLHITFFEKKTFYVLPPPIF